MSPWGLDSRVNIGCDELECPASPEVIGSNEIDAITAWNRRAEAVRPVAVGGPDDRLNGFRPLPWARETLGRFVREAWVRWAETQPDPKASWLVPYDDLSEADKEADMQIGEAVARWTLIGDASRSALVAQPAEPVQAAQEPVVDSFGRDIVKSKLVSIVLRMELICHLTSQRRQS